MILAVCFCWGWYLLRLGLFVVLLGLVSLFDYGFLSCWLVLVWVLDCGFVYLVIGLISIAADYMVIWGILGFVLIVGFGCLWLCSLF